MNTELVDKKQYFKIVEPQYIFDSVAFNELNKYKVEELYYLLFKDTKYRFGICVGIRDGAALCPFSAPFASLVAIRKPASIEQYDQALDSLDSFLLEKRYKSIKLIMPPMFYDQTGISVLVNSLLRKNYCFKNTDLNFHFDLVKACASGFSESLPHNGRKNLRIGLNSGLTLKYCSTDAEKQKAYDIIAENRESKGYPLKMTFQQVMNTVAIVDHDFFLVMTDQEAIASALIYLVNADVAQVIYWGDRPGFSELKPINFLSYQLIHHYGKKSLKYLDIGPSTDESIPNYGLCDFKASIGCDSSVKFTMIKFFDGIA